MLPVLLPRRRNDYEPLTLMRREFDRLFRDMWGNLPEEREMTAAYPVDIREEDDSIMVEAELPGFKREEIDVNLDQGILSISAERKSEEEKGKEHLNERRFTRVERSFTLPAAVDESNVDAKLEDGVLRLRMPKGEEAKPKRIEVK